MPLSMPYQIVISASPAKMRLRSVSRSDGLVWMADADLAPLVPDQLEHVGLLGVLAGVSTTSSIGRPSGSSRMPCPSR